MYFILPLLGGLVLYFITSAAVRIPGDSLQSNFASVADAGGVIKGKTYAEILAKCGQPSAVSSLGNGKTLRQWQATGYHIALIFDSNDICEGISSEIKV